MRRGPLLINRITHYDSRRLENFAKYEAVRLAEELVSVAKTTGYAKVASYDIIATTLKEKIHVSKEQFKAYFLALLYLYVHILPTPPPPPSPFSQALPCKTLFINFYHPFPPRMTFSKGSSLSLSDNRG